MEAGLEIFSWLFLCLLGCRSVFTDLLQHFFFCIFAVPSSSLLLLGVPLHCLATLSPSDAPFKLS